MAFKPTSDGFDYGNAGSDHYGSRLLGYLGWEPKSGVDAGVLVRSASAGSSRAFAIGEQSIATNGEVPVAFMRRESFAADVSVRAFFKFVAVAGVALTDHGSEFGVFARATSGTLTDDLTEFVRYVDGDAYAALFTRTGSNEYSAKIVRWSGGVETLLASESYTIQLPTLVSKSFRFRLDVSTNTSGDVDLSLQVQNFKAHSVSPARPSRGIMSVSSGDGQIFDVKNNWFELLTVTDSSGSKITGGGRCGFVTEREREYDSGATRIVTATSLFGVFSLNDTPLWVDDMLRSNYLLCRQFTSAWGSTTYSLASDFTNDWFSDEQDPTQVLRRDAGGENVLQQNQGSGGQAVDLVPGTGDYIELDLSDPKYVSNIVARSLTKFTLSVFANIDTNDTGNIVFDDFLDLGNGTSLGMTLGLKPGVGANTYRMFATVSSLSSGSGTTLETADITEVGMLSTTTHFSWTISAANDRVRFYINGSLSVERAMTEAPQLRGSATTRVGWNGTAGSTTANFFDGRLDELRLYWDELDASEIAHLSDPSAVGVEIDRPKLLHGWSFDTAEFSAGGFGFDGDWLKAVYGVALPTSLKATLMGAAATVSGIANAARPRCLFGSQRPVDSPSSQHRGIKVTFENVNQTAGVFVRAGFTDQADFNGYRLDVRPDPAGEARLYRVVSGVETLIATALESIALSTQYEVRLSVDQASGTSANSPVLLNVYLDGIQVVMVASASGDVSADAAGTVRDMAADRILSGTFEGFHAHTPGGTDPIDFDDWAQGYLGGINFALTGPSVNLSTEISGVTGNLNDLLGIQPTLPQQRLQVGFLSLRQYESGHQLRMTRDVNSRRQFPVSVQVPVATLALFRSFWIAHRAHTIPFFFTPEGESQGIFAFIGKKYNAQPVSHDEWRLSFTLGERINPSPNAGALMPPSAIASPILWASAQSNVYSATPNTFPDSADVKLASVVSGDVHRVYGADVGMTPGPTLESFGRHLNGALSTGSASSQWALIEFASAGVINGKRSLEPRGSDEFYLARPNILPFVSPFWTDQGGFTLMAHLIPPTSGYGASEHIFHVADGSANTIMRIGWTDSRFYRTAGSAGVLASGYDFGGAVAAKTIVVRWVPGGDVHLWDGGGASVATASFSGLSMTSASPAASRIFVSSAAESTSIQADAGIGSKVFPQDFAVWDFALTDAEVDAVANYWSAQYGSTWTALVP